MPNKQLTARLKLNTTQAEQKLRNIAKAIDALNKAVNQQSNAYSQVDAALKSSTRSTTKAKAETDKLANSAKKVNHNFQSTSGTLGSLASKLKGIAATYLGIMGLRTVVDTSDTITSAQNKLNYVSAQQLGSDAYNSDGSYSNKTIQQTQNTMDKMYASAQKVRMSYTDMMSNVSKSITLAGDAFQNNTDNAIRFQEIMAEAYTLGGASASEMSTSMYQLIQALGAGILAGDELRSVREGAPLAYKAIEEFVQGVYNSEESLKELASQGKVTSDMVVAAIMNSGNKMDSAFAQTAQTFAQTWDQIKNSAKKAFEPVSNMLRDTLNQAIDNGLIEKVEIFFAYLSKGLQFAFTLISNFVSWVADQWSWLKYVVCYVLLVIVALLIKVASTAIATALITAASWLAANWVLLLVVAVLMLIIYWFEEVCYGAAWLAAWIINIVFGIVNAIFAAITAVGVIVSWVITFIINLVMGCGEAIGAIAENIGIAFQNAFIWAKNTFWDFIADVLRGVSKLEPVINGIAKLLGKDGVDFGGLIDSVESKKSEYKSFRSVGDAWSSGLNTMGYADMGEMTSGALNTLEYVDANAWGSAAGNWGAGVKNSVTDSISAGIGVVDGFANANDSAYNVANAYNEPTNDELLKGVGDIADNTDSIADSMNLTQEDLEYLRKVADMEWKKEYTTASINVEMTNHNTVNGEYDLASLAIDLRDMIEEEMYAVADGVYAG